MKNSNSDFAGIALNKFHFLLLNFSVCLVFLIADSTYASANINFTPGIYQKADTTKKKLMIEYYSDGKVLEKGYHGHFENKEISTGCNLGTWYYYHPDGSLSKTIYYHNDVPSSAFIIKKTYHPNGKVKSIEKFNNHDLYQTEVKRLGNWQYFDDKGKLIREIKH